MARITVSQDDLNRSRVLDANWYPVEVTDVQEKPSKAQDSINYTFQFRVLDGPYRGAVVYRLFNEKAMGMIAPLIEAITGEKMSAGDYDLDMAKGKQLQIFCKPEMYEGTMQNRVIGFRSINFQG